MAITKDQREQRKKFLGSSDAAAVVGVDPYRTPLDVWYDKTGKLEPTGAEPANDAIDVGVFCERAVLDWFSAKQKIQLITNENGNDTRRVHENGIMAANFDALIEGDATQAVEAKTTGVVSNYIGEQWGEVGTSEVPDRVALQCQHQMAVLPTLQIMWVPVLMGGVGFRLYRVERNEDLIQNLTACEVAFWKNHVETNLAPEGLAASIDTFKKLIRIPEKSVEIPDAIVAAWIEAKDAVKQAEQTKKETELLLLAAIGDAELGKSGMGEVSYFTRTRKAYAVAEGKYRQLVFRKAKP